MGNPSLLTSKKCNKIGVKMANITRCWYFMVDDLIWAKQENQRKAKFPS
jgi:hypothetical protein